MMVIIKWLSISSSKTLNTIITKHCHHEYHSINIMTLLLLYHHDYNQMIINITNIIIIIKNIQHNHHIHCHDHKYSTTSLLIKYYVHLRKTTCWFCLDWQLSYLVWHLCVWSHSYSPLRHKIQTWVNKKWNTPKLFSHR